MVRLQSASTRGEGCFKLSVVDEYPWRRMVHL